MSVKQTQTYLVSGTVQKLKIMLSSMVSSQVSVEPLDPKSLNSSEWATVKFVGEGYEDNSDLKVLETVIKQFQPTGIVASISDERVEVDPILLDKALEQKEMIMAKALELKEKIDALEPKEKLSPIEPENYYKLISLHSALKLKDRVNEASKFIFKTEENSKLTFMFLAIKPSDKESFESVAKRNSIAFKESGWDKEIVDWNNKGGLQSFQDIIQGLGTIGTKESDPTVFVAIFFMTFFAFSLSDAVYGILLVALTGPFYLTGKVKPALKSIFGLFFYTGIATILFGALTKSWLGDLTYKFGLEPIDNILQQFQLVDVLGSETTEKLKDGVITQDQVPFVNDLIGNSVSPIVFMMGLAIVIGFSQVLVGYYLLSVNKLKEGKMFEVFESLNWIAFIFALIFTLVSLATSSALMPVSLAVLGATILGLFIFNQGKSPVSKIIGGAGKLYGLISLFSDLVSYTRLVAVGLTGAIIASVINILAGLLMGDGTNIILIIIGIIFLIIGHLFNLVVSLFGAYINSLRLHYVEFTPKFYEGNAKQFKPISTDFEYLKLAKTQN